MHVYCSVYVMYIMHLLGCKNIEAKQVIFLHGTTYMISLFIFLIPSPSPLLVSGNFDMVGLYM